MGKIKLSTTEAFRRIREVNPNVEILSKNYVNNCSPLSLECKVCKHKWKTSYSALANQGTGCPKCVGNAKFSMDEAFGYIKAKHPNIEILSKEYLGIRSPLNLKCEVCKHKWQARYTNLVHRNVGCPKCLKQARFSTDKAFSYIKEKHPNIQILSKKYQSIYSPLSLKCKACKHKWQATYTNLVHKGTRCPKCARKMTKGEKHIFDLLIGCGLVYCSSLDEALAREKARLTKN